MNTAAMVRKRKEAHPELYCTDRRCLWRTGGGSCPRHKPIADAAPIVRAIRDVPEERRMDAVAVAVGAFIQTDGKLTP